jgi:hypothetical protein
VTHEEGQYGGTQARKGCWFGTIAAAAIYVFPIPVALIVWIFDLKVWFGDYMLMTILFLMILPQIGAGLPAGPVLKALACYK